MHYDLGVGHSESVSSSCVSLSCIMCIIFLTQGPGVPGVGHCQMVYRLPFDICYAMSVSEVTEGCVKVVLNTVRNVKAAGFFGQFCRPKNIHKHFARQTKFLTASMIDLGLPPIRRSQTCIRPSSKL